MHELAKHYRDDKSSLEQEFIWMKLLLERTETITVQEKLKIQEKLTMFDQLWEESPTTQNMHPCYKRCATS